MKVRLKKLKKNEDYGTDICAATRCREPTTVILAIIDKREHGLCQEHWEKHCKEKP